MKKGTQLQDVARRLDRKDHHAKRAEKEEKQMLSKFQKHINVWHSGKAKDVDKLSSVHIVELRFDTPISPRDLAVLLVEAIGDKLNE